MILVRKFKVAAYIVRNSGFRELLTQSKMVVVKAFANKFNPTVKDTGDILFISVSEPLLDRYRTDHMVEELKSVGMSVGKIFDYQLTPEYAKYYNSFVFYRCPWMPQFEGFFKEARRRNKALIYTLDDLVIDNRYTDKLPTVKNLSKEDLKLYNEGVVRQKKVMKNCDYFIVTTDQLAEELSRYDNFKEGFINRNAVSNEMVHYSNMAIKETVREADKIVVGYFSGTSTHNEDFQMIAPALVKLMDDNPRVYVKLAGRVDAPEEFKNHKDRIIYTPYVDWRELPFEMRKCDIILAPLTDSLCNRAKSENKWTEASLIATATVASDIGAFHKVIENNRTGVLVNNTTKDWYDGIKRLIDNDGLRLGVSINSRDFVLRNYRTIGRNAIELKAFIDKVTPEVIAFSGVNFGDVSGGNIVIKKHMDILRADGKIVYGVENMEYRKKDKWVKGNQRDDKKYDIFRINSKRSGDLVNLKISFNKFIATYWQSVDTVDKYQYMKSGFGKKLYLVQGMESEFFKETDPLRLAIYATYTNSRLQIVTISKWCQFWLKDEFGREAMYAPNGITLDNFKFKNRKLQNRKIRVLVEGNNKSENKRVDESFEIANKLDRNRFEISYLSYNSKPKKWYKIDNFYNNITSEKVGEVYRENDILIKSSVLESFSYPPIEMMATGGVAVVVKNEGNSEYIRDGENALCYEPGDVSGAVEKIETLVSDKKQFTKLAKNGRSTAESRDWNIVRGDIVNLYK